MGLIALKGMEFFAYHGFYEEEQKIGNKYEVDVMVETDFLKAGEEDDLTKTVNYEGIYDLVNKRMQVSAKLLEHLAYEMANQLKNDFSNVEKVTVEVRKCNPPIGGVCQYATVSITL